MSVLFGILVGMLIAAAVFAIVGIRPNVDISDIQTTLLFVDVHTVMHDQTYPSGVSVVPIDVPANKTINDCVTSIDL